MCRKCISKPKIHPEFEAIKALEPKANCKTRTGQLARAKWWFEKMRQAVNNNSK